MVYIVTENGYYEYKMYNKTKLTTEAIQLAKEAQQREAYNPYSRELMKQYIELAQGQLFI